MQLPNIENDVGDGNLGDGLAKDKLFSDMRRLLKVPKCEIFDPFFFTPINPIWVGDSRTGRKKIFCRRLRQIFAILFFLRRLSLR